MRARLAVVPVLVALASSAVALVVCLGAAGLSAQKEPPPKPGGGPAHHEMFDRCAKACNDCQRICDACSQHCGHLVAAGKKEHMKTLRTCQDCADACAAAARIVSRFDNQAIRTVVEKARFSDPVATDYLTDILITRRDKVLRTWLTPINPLVDFALSATT